MEQVRRSECLMHCRLLLETSFRVLYVEAQAGQGKTTLARQFVQESDCPTYWHTCQSIDTDPVVFLRNIIHGLHRVIPSLSIASLLESFSHRKCETNLTDQPLQLLCRQPAVTNAPMTLVVFDDAQALLNSSASLLMLRNFARHTPQQFRFLVITRHRLSLNGHSLFAPAQSLSLDNDLLSFKKEEAAILYNCVLKIPKSSEDITRLINATGGWVAGLMLLQHDSPANISWLDSRGTPRLDKYFDRLFIGLLSDETLNEIATLALPEKLPFGLLNHAVSPSTAAFVRQQLRCEFFMWKDDNGNTPVLRFHLLLRSYLRRRAHSHISKQSRTTVYRLSGEWWISEGNILAALEDYLRARDWETVANILHEHGQHLLTTNQHKSLQRILGEMPNSIVSLSGWLLYLKGASRNLPHQVVAAREELIRAISIFDRSKNQRGTLLALASLLYFPFFFSIEYGTKSLLRRGIRLFDALYPSLDKISALHFAQAAAGAILYYLADFEKAQQYIIIARSISSELGHSDTSLELVANEILLKGMRGDLQGAYELIDNTFVQANFTSVNENLRMNYKIVQAIILALSGLEINYDECKEALHGQHASSLANSVLASFLVLRDIEFLVSHEDFKRALLLTSNALNDTSKVRHPHATSQLIHFKVLCMAYLGDVHNILPEVRRSLRLRAKAEGRHFALINLSVLGGALSLCPKHVHLAERMLTRAIEACLALRNYNLLLTPLAYRAALRLRHNKSEEARADITRLLRILDIHTKHHFLGWTPRLMAPLLKAAVIWGEEVTYARNHARFRMGLDILSDGSFVPLLKIQTIGGLNLRVSGASQVLAPPQLTPLQVRLLTQLATSPKGSMSLEKIDQSLWPERVNDVRTKFDTLLSRLRKTLADAFGHDASKRYLVMKAGQLSLEHCVTDISIAIGEANQGLQLIKSSHTWQAHLAFTRMSNALGGGTINSGLFMFDAKLPVAFHTLFASAASAWVNILRDCGRFQLALAVTKQALELDPISDELQRLRYNLLIALNKPGEAMYGLDEYRRQLQTYDFPPFEIEQAIDSIWA